MDAFKKYQNKLTYFDFNQVAISIGVDFVAGWMFEDFLSDLDSMGLAFIELNDIASWLQSYGFDLGIQVSSIDESTNLQKKLAIGPSEYQIDETKDYYRGVSTILNSEIAALTKVIELSSLIEEGQLFFDKDFGP